MDKITLTFTYKSWALQIDKKTSSISKMKKLVADDIRRVLMNGYNVDGDDESFLCVTIPFFSPKYICDYREVKITFDDKCEFKCTESTYMAKSREYEIECEGNINVTVTLKY